MGWREIDRNAQVGNLLAEETVVFSAILVLRIDISGKAAVVYLMPACGNHHHRPVRRKNATSECVAEP